MSLGLLVGRFGNYVRETYVPPVQALPEEDFPDSLNHVREAAGHHLIPLILIAHADGDFAPSERDVIVTHCVTLAQSRGLEINGKDTLAFSDYVQDFRPTLVQLEPALHRLSHSPHEEIVLLIDAARAVVQADGVTRPEETRLLQEMSEELARLKAAV
jgi:tellurite resistance protein